MRKSASLLSLALLLGAAVPAQAAINTIDNVPAATLLLPYFEIDTANANGLRTVFTVGNSSANEVLAHVTLWTDRGVPTYSFNLRLSARDMAEIDLRELFVNGVLPQSTAGGFAASCGGQLPPAPLNATQTAGLRNAHTGLASSTLGGMCGGAALGDGRVRGYATVDVVGSCTNLFPGDAGYFVSGGTGIARNDNVLWGEQSSFDPSQNIAYGDSLVHIEASASAPQTDGVLAMGQMFPDYTFYGRLVGGTAADNREGLPRTYMGRYSLSGVVDNTTVQVWRDPGDVSPFACNAQPSGLTETEVFAFDHQEEPYFVRPAARFPRATQSLALSGSGANALPFNLGFLFYSLDLSADSAPFGQANQAFVSHVLRSGTGNAGQSTAWPIWPITYPFTSYFGGFPQCSDGIDNDSDGQIDFPADSGCLAANSPSENPQCSDGIDNDSDTFIDFPADLDCSNPRDNTENQMEQACRDGIDNDNDGLIDWPADPGCSNPGDNTEYRGECDDGIDNDSDSQIDFPADVGCSSASDPTETASACGDGIDNDMDGQIDFPADLGCTDVNDSNETNAVCADGIDNDMDGLIDFPADLGCTDQFDGDETNPACIDGIDNDTDGLIDFPADPGCQSAASFNESPQCNNGMDDDLDGVIDFPADQGCSAAFDTSEYTEQCSDGIDNDSDGRIDYPNDPGCSSPRDEFEGPDCSSLDVINNFPNPGFPVDNDLDGLANFGNDPGCASETDDNELAGTLAHACADGIDNDGDGLIDFPNDPGCRSAADDVEYVPGEALAVAESVPVPASNSATLMLSALLMMVFGGLWMRRRNSQRS